jgi:hypothetical protein
MGRSPGFASIVPDIIRPIQTRFPCGSPPEGVNPPDTITRRIIMQKARGHTTRRYSAPTACRHGVSGSVSSPYRGSSHRSVALLGSLSVVIECLALREGPRRFRPGFTCPTLLGYRIGSLALSPTGLSPALVPLSSGLRLTLTNSMAPAPRPRVVTHSV